MSSSNARYSYTSSVRCTVRVTNSARKLHIRFRITWKHDIAIGYGDGHGAWALKTGTRLLCIIPSGIVRLIAVF